MRAFPRSLALGTVKSGTAIGNQNDFNISAVFTSFLGAAVLLAGVFYFRRPAAR